MSGINGLDFVMRTGEIIYVEGDWIVEVQLNIFNNFLSSLDLEKVVNLTEEYVRAANDGTKCVWLDDLLKTNHIQPCMYAPYSLSKGHKVSYREKLEMVFINHLLSSK